MRASTVGLVVICGLLMCAGARAADHPDVVTWDAVNKQANLEPLVKQSLKFLTGVAKGNFSDAQRLFQMKDSLRDELQRGHFAELLGRVNLRPPYDIDLVGLNLITNDDMVLIFVTNTADGPVAFKMDVYRFQGSQYVAHVDATDDWDEIETLLATVNRLNVPLQFRVNPADPSGDPEIVQPSAAATAN